MLIVCLIFIYLCSLVLSLIGFFKESRDKYYGYNYLDVIGCTALSLLPVVNSIIAFYTVDDFLRPTKIGVVLRKRVFWAK